MAIANLFLRYTRKVPVCWHNREVDYQSIKVQWLLSEDSTFDYEAEVDCLHWQVGIGSKSPNGFYVLVVDGNEVSRFDNWPDSWSRPGDSYEQAIYDHEINKLQDQQSIAHSPTVMPPDDVRHSQPSYINYKGQQLTVSEYFDAIERKETEDLVKLEQAGLDRGVEQFDLAKLQELAHHSRCVTIPDEDSLKFRYYWGDPPFKTLASFSDHLLEMEVWEFD